MLKRRKEDAAPLRCPRCGAETRGLVRCSACRRRGCEEACVPNGEGTVCASCASPGEDEGGLDGPNPDRDEEE
jgi:hypothetical protein